MFFPPLLTRVYAIGSLHSGLYLTARRNYTPGAVLRRLDGEEAVLTASRRARPDPGNVFRYAACHAIMDSGYFPAFDRVHNIMSLLGPTLRGEQVVLLKARKEYTYNRPLYVKCRGRRLWLVHQRASRTLPGDQQMGGQLEAKEAADLLKDCFPYVDKRDYDKLEDIGTDSGPKLAALCQALSRWSRQQSATATALPSLWDIPHRVESGRLFNHVKRGVEAGHILAFEYAPAPNSEQESPATFTPSPDTRLTLNEIVRRQTAEREAKRRANLPMTLPPAEVTIREFAQDEGLNERETEQLVRALMVSRTRAEAIGEIAGQQAIADAGHVRDENFVVRYHGPDDMTRNDDGDNLREWEFKGNGENSREVATDSKDRKQGSVKKNKARAKKMTKDKIPKIGQPSGRQGGTYTHGEINVLWREIKNAKGEKEHYSVHANTEAGSYKIYQRDSDGEIIQTSKPILGSIKNFADKKSIVEKLFPR